jgi:hypothetical protein
MNTKPLDRRSLAVAVGLCLVFLGLATAACAFVSGVLLVAALVAAAFLFWFTMALNSRPLATGPSPRVRDVVQACMLTSLATVPLVGLVFPACEINARAAINRDVYLRMREFNKALHGYAGEHDQRLPAHAIYSKDGRPLLSWRVALLPYLGHEELHRRFKLDEPWESPHNLALAEEIPVVYAPPRGWGDKGVPHATYFVVYVGPGAAFEGSEGVRLTDFPDGKDKTILFVVAQEPVTWTRPQDLEFPAQGPPPRPYPHSFDYDLASAVNVDESLRSVNSGWTDAELRALITRNGGEPFPEW